MGAPAPRVADDPADVWPVERLRRGHKVNCTPDVGEVPAIDGLDDVRCGVVGCSCGLSLSSALTVLARRITPRATKAVHISGLSELSPALPHHG